MKTTVEQQSPTMRKLTIEVPAEELAPVYESTLKRLSRQVKIPGFRPGKAPRSVLESRIGKDAIREEVLKDALPTFYAQAVTEQDLKPLTRPELEVVDYEDGQPVTLTATIEVRPEFKLPDYKGLEVSPPTLEVSEEEVQAQVDRLREQFGTLDEAAKIAVKGDYVTIDMFATRHGERVEGTEAQDIVYEVGSGSYIPQLDEELDGKREGDILKFNAPLPAPLDEQPQAPGLNDPPKMVEVTFQVVVKKVQVKKLPVADDEFAKLASEFDTLDELKSELRSRIESAKKTESDMAVRNSLVEDLLDAAEVPLPESMVAAETEARLARLIRELERAGLTIENYLEANGSTQEELVEQAKKAAEETVTADLILEAVAKAENITVDGQDVVVQVAALAQRQGRDTKEVLKEFTDSGRVNVLAGDILRSKALDFLVEHAQIKAQAKNEPGTGESAGDIKEPSSDPEQE